MSALNRTPLAQTTCTPQERQQYLSLLNRAVEARPTAYVPRSHYQVGAAALGSSGEVYTGGNCELTAYVDHAEQVAMARALAAGEKEVVALATFGAPQGEAHDKDFHEQTPPCGNCRQAAFDLNARMKEVEADGQGQVRVYNIADELPEAYYRDRAPYAPPAAPAGIGDPLLAEAFLARSRAWTPKTQYPVGAAVETDNGHLYKGVKVETSSMASQAERMAIDDALLSGERHIKRIAIVGGNDPQRGEMPPDLTWDALQGLAKISPEAQVLLPDKDGHFVAHSLKEGPEMLITR